MEKLRACLEGQGQDRERRIHAGRIGEGARIGTEDVREAVQAEGGIHTACFRIHAHVETAEMVRTDTEARREDLPGADAREDIVGELPCNFRPSLLVRGQPAIDDHVSLSVQLETAGMKTTDRGFHTGELSEFSHDSVMGAAVTGEEPSEPSGARKRILEFEALLAHFRILGAVNLERASMSADLSIEEPEMEPLGVHIEVFPESRESGSEPGLKEEPGVPERRTGQDEFSATETELGALSIGPSHEDRALSGLDVFGLKFREEMEPLPECGLEHGVRHALLAVDGAAAEAHDAVVSLVPATVVLGSEFGLCDVAEPGMSLDEDPGTLAPVLFVDRSHLEQGFRLFVPRVHGLGGEEVDPRDGAPGSKGVFVESVQNGLISKRTSAHSFPPHDPVAACRIHFEAAGPVDLRVRVDFGHGKQVPGEIAAGLENEAPDARKGELAGKNRPRRAGSDYDDFVGITDFRVHATHLHGRRVRRRI